MKYKTLTKIPTTKKIVDFFTFKFFLWKMLLIPFITYTMIIGIQSLGSGQALRSGTLPFVMNNYHIFVSNVISNNTYSQIIFAFEE